MKTIYLKGDIGWEITANKLREMIDLKSTEKLQILINSAGGLVIEAYEIYDLLSTYKGQIEMVIMPFAASAASYLVMAGDRISAFKNSIWMAHPPMGLAIGNADEMMSVAKILQGLESIIIEAYQKRLSGTKEEIKQRLKENIWLIGWEQLTENGIIDNVIDSLDEIEIDESERIEIESAIKESEKENANNFLSMRIKKIEKRIKDDNIDLVNNYEQIAAKLDIKNIIADYENPYPNEHSARLRESSDFAEDAIWQDGKKGKFRRSTTKEYQGKKASKEFDVIWGKLKGKSGKDDPPVGQALRFNKNKWSAAEAKKWLKDNNIKYIRFEPASNAEDSAEDKILMMEDNAMTLQQFLESNPDAKAEYDSVLESAKTQVKTEMTNILNKDRERLAKVLELENVPLSQAARDAIVGEATIENYMEAKIKEQRNKREDDNKSKSPFDKLVGKQLPAEQDPKGAEEQKDKENMEEFDKESEKLAKEYFGGKK